MGAVDGNRGGLTHYCVELCSIGVLLGAVGIAVGIVVGIVVGVVPGFVAAV